VALREMQHTKSILETPNLIDYTPDCLYTSGNILLTLPNTLFECCRTTLERPHRTDTARAFLISPNRRDNTQIKMSNQGAPNGLEITESVLKRIADIYNGIARAALVTINFSCLTRFVDYPNGSLELWVEHSHSSLAEGSLWPEGTPEPVYMAAMSYNRCVTAVEMCSGILAFLTKGVYNKRTRISLANPK
jgi:hypothetical protein